MNIQNILKSVYVYLARQNLTKQIVRRYRMNYRNQTLIQYLKNQEHLNEIQATALDFLKYNKKGIYDDAFYNIFRISQTNCFDLNGAIFPVQFIDVIKAIYGFDDIYLIECLCNGNYEKHIYDHFYSRFGEGAYGYTEGDFDVVVKEGDIVIDAGSCYGDFAAYAASKSAICYAFEPESQNYQHLLKTQKVNALYGKGKIIPVNAGLGQENAELFISSAGASSKVSEGPIDNLSQKIVITSLDNFTKTNNIKIDFIKCDIEGAERDMLKGAKYVLKNFAPKLAIRTYHLPDDPHVLENIILEINPNYKIIQKRQTLFASV